MIFSYPPVLPNALPSRTSALERTSTRTTRAETSQQKTVRASTTAIERFVIVEAYAVLADEHRRASDAKRDGSESPWRARSRSRSARAGARVRGRSAPRFSTGRFL